MERDNPFEIETSQLLIYQLMCNSLQIAYLFQDKKVFHFKDNKGHVGFWKRISFFQKGGPFCL